MLAGKPTNNQILQNLLMMIFTHLVNIVMLVSILVSGSGSIDAPGKGHEQTNDPRIERFTFSNHGIATKGKIFLPPSFNTNKNLPAIYLIDFAEQHFKLATDEFERVIDGVQKIEHLEALVISLDGIPDIDAEPDTFLEHYQMFKNLTAYVDENYTSNSSRTFIGKGSESGIVLMTMFLEDPETSVFDQFIATDPSGLYASAIIDLIEKNAFPQGKSTKKLHFSFSTSNDRNKCRKLIDLIQNADYPWIRFQAKAYLNSNYENTYPVAFAEALEYIFNTE